MNFQNNSGFLKTTKTKQDKQTFVKPKLAKSKEWQRTDKRKAYE